MTHFMLDMSKKKEFPTLNLHNMLNKSASFFQIFTNSQLVELKESARKKDTFRVSLWSASLSFSLRTLGSLKRIEIVQPEIREWRPFYGGIFNEKR